MGALDTESDQVKVKQSERFYPSIIRKEIENIL